MLVDIQCDLPKFQQTVICSLEEFLALIEARVVKIRVLIVRFIFYINRKRIFLRFT